MRLPPKLWNLLASRKTRIALACAPFAFCLLVLMFYFGTSWWGRSQMKALLRDFESAGYAVDPEKYWLPATDPSDDLFQDSSFQQELKDAELVPLMTNRPKMSRLASRLPKPEPSLARVTDLAHWVDPPASDDRAAAEILLKEHHLAVERLEALRPVLARSKQVVWPVDVSFVEMSDYSPYAPTEYSAATESMLKLNISAEAAGEIAVFQLGVGDSDQAAGAVAAMLDIVRLEMDPKPKLVSVVIANRLLQRTQTLIWEGVVRGAWSNEQLLSFDQSLAALDPQHAAVNSHLGEIALLRLEAKEVLAATRALPKINVDWPAAWKWDTSAIWEEAKEAGRQLRSPGLELAKRVKSQREYLDGIARTGGAPRERFTPQDLAGFRRMTEAPDVDPFGHPGGAKGLGFLAAWALRMETSIAITRTGIALERYRLRAGNGSYPASLEALVPDLLPEVPVDPFAGQPLRYRLQADGSPHVWSVGENFTDDSGLPSFDFEQGDLIWITRPIPGFTEKDFRRR